MRAWWLDLGFQRYEPAFAVQEKVFEACSQGRIPPVVIQQENPPTFTLGRAGTLDNLLLEPGELARRGVEVVHVNRGGDITYHGPGQLIASPLLYLGDLNLNANQYLHRLEDLLIQALAGYGLEGDKNPDYPGVWLGEAKIAAVGIAVRHGYTFHGFSLNVCLDLQPFEWIHPCGVPRMPVTSMEKALGRPVSMAEAGASVRAALAECLDLQFEDATLEDLELAWPGKGPGPDRA